MVNAKAYKAAGVDVEAGYESVRLMKSHVQRTFRPEVMTDLGGFGGVFALAKDKYEEPLLVSGTDGVGTKLKLAFLQDKHDTIGIDAVAMCVNDIVCCGAEPLFFLDYIALGKNVPTKVADIVKGVSEGCVQSGCALIGGETAEMPGFYPEDEYDIAGFSVGIVDKKKLIDGKNIVPGDKLIGLYSSGIHSNGYSLVRKLINPTSERLKVYVEELGCTIGEELLRPTKIYVKMIQEVLKQYTIKGISNITGGGFYENIPRMLPENMTAKIKKGTWSPLPIFNYLQKLGDLSDTDMFSTFNMGIGMVLAVKPEDAEGILDAIRALGEKADLIGEVVEGDAGVELW